jgi:hypothetical protein
MEAREILNKIIRADEYEILVMPFRWRIIHNEQLYIHCGI